MSKTIKPFGPIGSAEARDSILERIGVILNLNAEVEDRAQALISLFVWEESVQGHQFWDDQFMTLESHGLNTEARAFLASLQAEVQELTFDEQA